MTEAKANRLSTKKLLDIFVKSRAENRQVLRTLCKPKRSAMVENDRWLRIIRDCHVDDKRMVWGVLKTRSLSVKELRVLEVYFNGFSGNLKKIAEEAHEMAVTICRQARLAAVA